MEEEFYSNDSIQDLMDDDEISIAEQGFMIGYMGA